MQTVHGWSSNSGNQKNQNYVVFVSNLLDSTFTNIATVAYLPFDGRGQLGSSKVVVTDNTTEILVSGVDQIRFTYTISASGGSHPSPTIREIDVFGIASNNVPDTTDPLLVSNSPEDNENPRSDLIGFYQWSPNLIDWYASGAEPDEGATVTAFPLATGDTTTVTGTASEALEQLFFRVVVQPN